MDFQVPEAAKLDESVRNALTVMSKGGADPETPEAIKVLMPHLVDTKVAEADAARMKVAREWTMQNAKCATCGLCSTFEVSSERCVVIRAERGLPFEPAV